MNVHVVYLSVIGLLFALLIGMKVTYTDNLSTTNNCPLIYDSDSQTYSLQTWIEHLYIGQPLDGTADTSIHLGNGDYGIGNNTITVEGTKLSLSNSQGELLLLITGDSIILGQPTEEVLASAVATPGLYVTGLPPDEQDTDSVWYSYMDAIFQHGTSTLKLRRVAFVDDTSINGWQLQTDANEITVAESVYIGKNIYRDTIIRNKGASLIINGTVVAQEQSVSTSIPVSCIKVPITGATNILQVTKYESPSSCGNIRIADRIQYTVQVGTGACLTRESYPEIADVISTSSNSFKLDGCPDLGDTAVINFVSYSSPDCTGTTLSHPSSYIQLHACIESQFSFTCERYTF